MLEASQESWSTFAKKFASAAETFSRFISAFQMMLFWTAAGGTRWT
jgi:hypothetical protein